ncbi:MAG: tRNA (uracil-5-)-methyltransferase [Chthoniobacter sp.]
MRRARRCCWIPPSEGLAPRVCDVLLGGAPAEVIYVSCNPATLARDLAALAGGYELQGVTPLDMFPQTAEIEVIAHLTRRG